MDDTDLVALWSTGPLAIDPRGSSCLHEAGHGVMLWLLLGRPSGGFLTSISVEGVTDGMGVMLGGTLPTPGTLARLSQGQQAAVYVAGALADAHRQDCALTFDEAVAEVEARLDDNRAADDRGHLQDLEDAGVGTVADLVRVGVRIVLNEPDFPRLVAAVADVLMVSSTMDERGFMAAVSPP